VANNPVGSADPSGLDGGDLCSGFLDTSYLGTSDLNFECAAHVVPRAPWEVRITSTEFKIPMGIFSGENCLGCWPLNNTFSGQNIFSGQDCLTCFPLGPDVMQILAQVLSGNLAGALQDVGAIPTDAIDCRSGPCQVNPIMDATKPPCAPLKSKLSSLGRAGLARLNQAGAGVWHDLKWAAGIGCGAGVLIGTGVVAATDTFPLEGAGIVAGCIGGAAIGAAEAVPGVVIANMGEAIWSVGGDVAKIDSQPTCPVQ
jgi:hypothetical protein